MIPSNAASDGSGQELLRERPLPAGALTMSENGAQASIFEEGRNCRRIAQARRVALVIDGEDYFNAFVAAAERAQESIVIIAWDFNSAARLHFDGHESGTPAERCHES